MEGLEFLTLIVPKYSAILFMQGGGPTGPPTPHLSPVRAVIKGQTKKHMIKFCKKTNFEQFFNGFLPLSNGKTAKNRYSY